MSDINEKVIVQLNRLVGMGKSISWEISQGNSYGARPEVEVKIFSCNDLISEEFAPRDSEEYEEFDDDELFLKSLHAALKRAIDKVRKE